MKNTMDSTGRVPVTVEVPAALAESLQSGRYDCGPLLEFLAGESFTPEGVAETLLTLYFEFVRLIPRMHEEITVEAPELCEHLYVLERLYRAIKAMEEAEVRR